MLRMRDMPLLNAFWNESNWLCACPVFIKNEITAFENKDPAMTISVCSNYVSPIRFGYLHTAPHLPDINPPNPCAIHPQGLPADL